MTFSLRTCLRLALVAGALALTPAVMMAPSTPAAAHEFKAGSLVLHHPWTRATATGAPAAGGFLEIKNEGTEPDRLIGGTASFAGSVEVHEMKMDGDVMKMRQLSDGLEIPPGATVVLKPGSYHIMFQKLSQQLKEGELVKGTLTFEKAGEVAVEWKVEAIGASAPGKAAGGMADMPGMKH